MIFSLSYVNWICVPCVCSIDVISEAFEGQSAVNRQRMVYKAIWEELQSTVHAVDQMTTRTPTEAAAQKWWNIYENDNKSRNFLCSVFLLPFIKGISKLWAYFSHYCSCSLAVNPLPQKLILVEFIIFRALKKGLFVVGYGHTKSFVWYCSSTALVL
jgi:hypothetical protein